jgi:hypothetical protein
METGLRMCPRRNAAQEPHRKPRSPFSAVRFARRIIAKYGRFLRISNEEAPTFSAFQTGWRRERNSNPRYGFGAPNSDVSASYRQQKPRREFHSKTRHSSFATGPVSIRRPFANLRRMPGDSEAKSVHVEPRTLGMSSHVTPCLARSHDFEISAAKPLTEFQAESRSSCS